MGLKFELKNKGMRALMQEVENAKNQSITKGYTVKVGILVPKPYPDDPSVNVAEIATFHEYGNENLIPRPFFSKSQMFIAKSSNINRNIQKNVTKKIKSGRIPILSIDKELAHDIGSDAVGVIMRTIDKSNLYAPLAPVTLKNKKENPKRSMKVLKYMTFLYNSIDYKLIGPNRKESRSRASTMYVRSNAVGTSHLEMQYGSGSNI